MRIRAKKLTIISLAGTILALQCFALPYSLNRFYFQREEITDNPPDDYDDNGDYDYDSVFANWSVDSLKYFADSLSMNSFEEDTLEFEFIKSEAPDSLQKLVDSIYRKRFVADSLNRERIIFQRWFDSLPPKEQKTWLIENVIIPVKIHQTDSVIARRDSIKARRDSITEATPRILDTPFLPDSLHYKRLVMFTQDKKFGDIKVEKQDTTYNYYFYDYPFFRHDVNATWQGVAGSPTQYYNYLRRTESDYAGDATFFTAYNSWTYTPSTVPAYNTKTPYTELGYWGTPFAGENKEEINLRFMTTQNITPALNLTFELNKWGGKGQMVNENTQAYHIAFTGNYLGKKYLAHFGWIHSKIDRTENGGVTDTKWIKDTLVPSREISVNLQNASNVVRKNTIFLNESFRFPFGDDSLTTAFIGHDLDLSLYSKYYADLIADEAGSQFYNNQFYMHPTTSSDSLGTVKFDNKVYLRLQPWKETSIVNKIDVGIGDKYSNYYTFDEYTYIRGATRTNWNSVYTYAGVKGMYKQYFTWNANGQIYFAGQQAGDFNVQGNMDFNFFPFRKARKSPLSVGVHFSTSLQEPEYYEDRVWTNHYKWDEHFEKKSLTKISGTLDIPYWKLNMEVGYSMLGNTIYYDRYGIAQQCKDIVNVLTVALNKEFVVWWFHFDNRLLLQFSSNQEVAPVPLLSINLKYFLQFNVVKKVLQMQVGANLLYTTSWYLPCYNPVLGVYYNQRKEEFGNCPYIDVFANMQWKRACIFVKLENVNQGWPCNSNRDYFTSAGNIHTQFVVKFGIYWPFYIQPSKIQSHFHKEGNEHKH